MWDQLIGDFSDGADPGGGIYPVCGFFFGALLGHFQTEHDISHPYPCVSRLGFPSCAHAP